MRSADNMYYDEYGFCITPGIEMFSFLDINGLCANSHWAVNDAM